VPEGYFSILGCVPYSREVYYCAIINSQFPVLRKMRQFTPPELSGDASFGRNVRSKQSRMPDFSPALRWAAVLCLLLIGIAATAQALHSHPNELAGDAKHCATCQIAHAPAKVGPVFELVSRPAATVFLVSLSKCQPKALFASFSLFSRPPPAL
jgi:hypothetical protein